MPFLKVCISENNDNGHLYAVNRDWTDWLILCMAYNEPFTCLPFHSIILVWVDGWRVPGVDLVVTTVWTGPLVFISQGCEPAGH